MKIDTDISLFEYEHISHKAVVVFFGLGSHFVAVNCFLIAKSCPTLCDPVDCSLPGSSVHRILQAKILEWVAIPFSRDSFRPRDETWDSRIVADSSLSDPPGNSSSLNGWRPEF